MKDRWQQLAVSLRNELVKVQRVLRRIEEGWRRARLSADDYYLDAVALNLHGFYGGWERIFERIATVVEGARLIAGEQGVELQSHVFVGHEVKTIVEFIKERGFDLLVIGFMGHSALYDRVMGSTCQGLVRLASCAVLVVK
ncbi:MAG: universal stress protein [Phycisphaerae bacterium]|nr:universal stress protein [Phycisphaerae bacterium]